MQSLLEAWTKNYHYMQSTLNSAYNEVAFNEKLPITKENLSTKYTPFTYKYIALNEELPIMKQNLCIFFFVIGRVECMWTKQCKAMIKAWTNITTLWSMDSIVIINRAFYIAIFNVL